MAKLTEAEKQAIYEGLDVWAEGLVEMLRDDEEDPEGTLKTLNNTISGAKKLGIDLSDYVWED